MGDAPPDVLAEARALVANGFSVIPIDTRTKQPYFNLLPKDPRTRKATWNPFRERLPTADELTRWFDPRDRRDAAGAMALACGPAVDGVLCLDFDVVRFFDDWMAYVGTLASGLVIQKTGGGRRQVFFRCPAPGPNTNLAWMEDESEESGRTIAIETRGDGGYACLPPSLHPSGGRYEWIRGNLLSIPRIPQAHADALLAAARKLDECPHTKEERKRIEAEARGKHDQKAKASRNGSSDIIGQFNERHSLTSVLETHGYTQAPGGRYCRPGREGIGSISVREGRSVHFSTNDPLNDGALASGYGCHDAFDVFRMLEHGGDAKKAVKAAAEAMGLAPENKSAQAKGSGNLAVTAIEERRASQSPPVPLSLNMRAGLAQIRMAKVFCAQAGKFAGPSVRVAQAAFLYGREYGKWELGAIDTIGLPDASTLVDEVAADPQLGRQLEELRECSEEAMRKSARTLVDAVGEIHASDLLSQWEGFGRFCGESLGVAPVTVFRAFGLGQQDPAAEVRSVYPAAQIDEATAAKWGRRWSSSWRRRVG